MEGEEGLKYNYNKKQFTCKVKQAEVIVFVFVKEFLQYVCHFSFVMSSVFIFFVRFHVSCFNFHVVLLDLFFCSY